jgi:hypothetical protein
MAPCGYEAARVELRCRVSAEHAGQLILGHATIFTDGWARWVKDGYVYIGYVPAGRCCDPPEVSEGEKGATRRAATGRWPPLANRWSAM